MEIAVTTPNLPALTGRALLYRGAQCIQLNWDDEPGVWKDFEPFNPAELPARQLHRLRSEHRALVEQGVASVGCSLRHGRARRDGGWNGVPTPDFDPDGILVDANKFDAFPSVYRLPQSWRPQGASHHA